MATAAKIRRPVQKLALAPEPALRAVPTGSTLLDLQSGIGGWPRSEERRVGKEC